MKSKRVGFLIAIAVPIFILLAFVWKPLWTLNTGTPILLETIPVDPRDILYGDYVSLRFEVEEVRERDIDPGLLEKLSSDEFSESPAFAILERADGGTYKLQTVTDKRPENGIYLKGQLNHYGSSAIGQETIYYANFLPDRFYVPENTGMRLEELSRRGKLIASLKVRNGYAIVEDITEKK